MTLYIFNEFFFGFISEFLDILAIISILFGIFIIVSKNYITNCPENSHTNYYNVEE